MLRLALVLLFLLPSCARPAPSPGQTARTSADCIGGAEDFDGFEDEDGCYDADNDGDKILDQNDLCPMDPEDFDGYEDEDGCPDRDNDHDRILDADDHCPNEAEVYNGIDDEDGCPDRGQIRLHHPSHPIATRIYFREGDFALSEGQAPLLEAVAATIVGNPGVELVAIVVHGTAGEAGGEALLRDRGQAVEQELVQRGVATNRLTTIIAPVQTDTSKPEHHRFVEFWVMRMDGKQVTRWTGSAMEPVDGTRWVL